MIKTIKTAGITLICVLLLLSSTSCFNIVTGGNVDKEWPLNNSKNSHHSNAANSDSTSVDKNK